MATDSLPTKPARRARVRTSDRPSLLTWLGVVPFFLFAFAFLIAPASYLFLGSFQDLQGNFTLDNFRNLNQPIVVEAYKNSLQVSFATALGGTIFGFLLAYAVTLLSLIHI